MSRAQGEALCFDAPGQQRRPCAERDGRDRHGDLVEGTLVEELTRQVSAPTTQMSRSPADARIRGSAAATAPETKVTSAPAGIGSARVVKTNVGVSP